MTNPRSVETRDPAAKGQVGGISDGTSPAAGKVSSRRPEHRAEEKDRTRAETHPPVSSDPKRPTTRPDPHDERDAHGASGMPPGPLSPGNRG